MTATSKIKTQHIMGNEIKFSPGPFGVYSIEANDINSLMSGLGFMHAKDRGLQMLTNRVVLEGKLSELLKDTKDNFAIDKFIHSLDLLESSKKDAAHLDTEQLQFLQSYCDGINHYFRKFSRPWLHGILRVPFHSWKPEHSLGIMKLATFMGLAQGQIEIQSWLIEAIQKEVDFEKIKSLFDPHIKDYDLANLDRIKAASWDHSFAPKALPYQSSIPSFQASNNWALNGKKTRSGSPIHCFDPHLDCLRLPTMWYEVKLKTKEKIFQGISVPGVPGIVMGKSPQTAMSFTYGYMDMVDFFIEEIKKGEYLFDGEYHPLKEKKISIKRKKNKHPEITTFFHGSAGNLCLDPLKFKDPKDIPDGYYISWKWSGQNGMHLTLAAMKDFFEQDNALALRESIKKTSISGNWLITDKQNNIVLQQSGRLPKRKAEGLLPLPAWNKENLWDSMRSFDELYYEINPTSNFTSSANNQIPTVKSLPVINACKGEYRNDRIKSILSQDKKFTVDDMKSMQNETYSIKAKQVLDIILPHLPNSSITVNLKAWNFRYENNSKLPSLFEEIYFRLNQKLFGQNFMGEKNWNFFVKETPLYSNYHSKFDRILLFPDDRDMITWYKNTTHAIWLKTQLKVIIEDFAREQFKSNKWKKSRTFHITNFLQPALFQKIFRLNSGPVIFSGCSDSVNQSSVIKRGNSLYSSSASFRCIIDHGEDAYLSILPGGNSEKKGKHYIDQLKMWELGKYKKI